MTDFQTCDQEPFVTDVTAQDRSLEAAAQAVELLAQQIEGYLQRLRAAVCADLQTLQAEIADIVVETSFLDLTDTPSSYAGAGGEAVAVKAAEDGLEFVPFPAGVLPDLDDNTEVSSGREFNGNPTFFKLVNIGTLPNTTSKSVAHNIPADFVLVHAYGTANDPTADVAVPLIFSTHSFLSNGIWFNTTSTNVVVTTGSNRTNFTETWVVLEYYYR